MSSATIRPPRQPLVSTGGIDHHVADLTFTAAADVTLADLQRKLADADQWLPVDGDPALPLGKLVETNSSGPLRLGFGAWRDLLLGLQFTTRAGEFITAGARTMKNVAGYDLTKFMVGQHGIFGSILTITARTYRRPEQALLARFAPSDDLLGKLLPTVLRPQWSMLSGDSLFCGYFGDAKAIAFFDAALRESPAGPPIEVMPQTLEEDISFRASRWLPQRAGELRYRASVPPAKTLEFAHAANLGDYAADPAFGAVVGSCDADAKARIRESARSIGGTVAFDDPEDIATFFGASGAELALLQRLKTSFDGSAAAISSAQEHGP